MFVTISALKKRVRFVFTSSCLYKESYLIYVICSVQHILCCIIVVCLRLISGVTNVASFCGLFILVCPFGFSNVKGDERQPPVLGVQMVPKGTRVKFVPCNGLFFFFLNINHKWIPFHLNKKIWWQLHKLD
jgi:hypothetical protein